MIGQKPVWREGPSFSSQCALLGFSGPPLHDPFRPTISDLLDRRSTLRVQPRPLLIACDANSAASRKRALPPVFVIVRREFLPGRASAEGRASGTTNKNEG